MKNLMLEIFAPAASLGYGDPGGVSTRRSKGCFDSGCGSQEVLLRL